MNVMQNENFEVLHVIGEIKFCYVLFYYKKYILTKIIKLSGCGWINGEEPYLFCLMQTFS